jgi:Rv0078B-related antitoxin
LVCTPHIFLMLPDEQASPEQIAALRAMTGQERLRLAQQLYWSARKMKTAGVRAQHPDWSDAQIEAEVVRIFTHART